jgi:hypothetical protein
MPHTAEEAGPFGIGRVLRRALAAIGPNAVTLFALIALAAMPERALYHLVGLDTRLMQSTAKLLLAASGFLLKLAVIRLSLESFAGGRASLGACAGQAFRSFLPVLGMGLVAALPLALGILLLVFPGVMLATSIAAAIPAQIAEGTGVMDSLKRSVELTRGYRWKILAIFLITGAGFVPVLLAMMALWGVPFSAHTQFLAENYLARLLLDTITALVMAALYFELRAADDNATRTA